MNHEHITRVGESLANVFGIDGIRAHIVAGSQVLRHALANAYDVAYALDEDLGQAIDRVRAADSVCAHILGRILAGFLDVVRRPVYALDHVMASEEDRARAHARVNTRQADTNSLKQQQRTVVVSRSAGRLVTVTAGLLSGSDRARYSEEFQSELRELAEAGAGRWQQIGYAVRLLTRTGRLRIALRTSYRRGTSR